MTVTINSDSLLVEQGLTTTFIPGVDLLSVDVIQPVGAPQTYSVLVKTKTGNSVTLDMGTITNHKEWTNNQQGAIIAMNAITEIAQSCCAGGGGSGVTSVDGDTGPAVILPDMVGDSGAGGTRGYVPAPAAGDTAAGKYLKADGTWEIPPVGAGDVVGPASSVDSNIPQFDGVTGKLLKDGLGTSPGGFMASDAGKVVLFGPNGGITAFADGTISGSAFSAALIGGPDTRTAIAAQSVDSFAIVANNMSAIRPPLESNNDDPTNVGPLAHFHRRDGFGVEVLNDGGLSWTSGTGAQTSADNLPVVGSANKGVAPVSGGGTTNFLRADATWADPAPTTTTIGALINSATDKPTPVDADLLGLADSAASFVLKKLTWANVKATLKTYFDTLYPNRTLVINSQIGTTYTLAATDDLGTTAMVRLTNASPIALTFPENATVAIPVGFRARIKATGAGQVTVTFAGATSVNSMGNAYKTAGQFAEFDVTKTATDTWAIDGNLTT